VTVEPPDLPDGDGDSIAEIPGAEIQGMSSVEIPQPSTDPTQVAEVEAKPADPFDEIDLGEYFDQYLDPGFKSPALENVEKPSFETFLSSPVTLSDHLRSQLALVALSEAVRDAAEAIIGNLDENGYLMSSPEELAAED